MRPLENATVRIQDLNVQVVAAANGSFQFLDVPIGKHAIEAQAQGYAGISKTANVTSAKAALVQFVLAKLVTSEPHVEVFTHVGIINYSVGPSSYVGGPTCSDACDWFFNLPKQPADQVLIEVGGRHSVSNPRGKDMLSLTITGRPNNSSEFRFLWICSQGAGSWSTGGFDAACSNMPLRIPINGTNLTAEANPKVGRLERLEMKYMCDNTWACLDDRFTFYISVFLDWEGEIPLDYTARPSG